MAEMTIKGAIQNTRNSEADAQGYALPPIAANLKDGQIAINTCETDPCIFFKTSEGKIVKIVSEEKLTKALTDILGNSAADLDTLRELIALFEGSANDILPMLTALTDRVTAAETSLTSKADKSVLNAHTGNTSNPHSVTKAQVGLSNVDNTADSAKPVSTAQATAIADAKKTGTDAQSNLTSHVNNKANPHGVTAAQVGALAVGATAADSKKLGGRLAADFWHKGNNLIAYPNNTNVDNINSSLWCSGMYVSGEGVPSHLSYSQVYQLGASYNGAGLQFAQNYGSGNSNLMFRTKGDSPTAHWNDWFTLYHAGNSNNNKADWSAKKIYIHGDKDVSSVIDFISDGIAKGFIGYQRSSNMLAFGTTNSLLQLDGATLKWNGYTVYNSNNSNKSTVDWTCKRLLTSDVISQSRTDLGWMINSMNNGDVSYFCGVYTNECRIGTSNNKDFQIFSNDVLRIHVSKGGNVGFGTNNPTDRIHAVGNIRATEKVIAGGNVESSGSGIFAGDIIAKKSGAVTFSTSDAAAGATRLNDLVDVKLPTNLADKMVLAYDPAQTNSDGSKGGYTFMPSAGTGTGTVSSAEIASLPDHNHNDLVYTSDERLKENITDLKDRAIKMILSLSPKSFTWNATAQSFGLNDPISYGLIAQEVEKVMPELVKSLGKEDYIGVDYIKIIPILLAGVQEQHKEIIALNQKLKTIQARANKAYGNETNNADKIAQLEAEIEELKMLIKK